MSNMTAPSPKEASSAFLPVPDAVNVHQHGADDGQGRLARLRRVLPYLVGAGMFAVAVWVLHSALRRYHLADLQSELAEISNYHIGLAVLYTFLSFVALVGYEFSALSMIGRRLPLPQLALASFVTQSIAHSTGFAFVIGATLRYNFYAERGLGIADVAKVQMFFTATFTLGVATLAGAVVMIEPVRLAAATGLPPWLWRLGAGTALALVIAYVVWGAFFHRPLRWRGHELVLPSAGATLTQIFFGVADLMAVAAALFVLLPPELGLGYLEVLAVFMASIVVGLMSHVPGSLGVFESAVVLLLQPTEAQTLPLIGSLLAFRGIYYLLPLVCGVIVLTLSEVHRWRTALARLTDRLRLDLGPAAPRIVAALAFLAGAALLLTGSLLAPHLPAAGRVAEFGRTIELASGLSLLLLARGLVQRLAAAWQWGLALLMLGAAASALAGTPLLVGGLLLLAAGLLFVCRRDFARPAAPAGGWPSPTWIVLLALTLASSVWLIGRG
jgi:uncharacterized membrane protein YbhN (UPF0104 family)